MSCTGSTSCRPTRWGTEASLLATQNMLEDFTIFAISFFSGVIFAVSGYVVNMKYI